MRLAILLSLALPLAAFAQQPAAKPAAKPAATPFPDVTTLSGRTLKNARVFRAEPDGLNFMFTGGMVKIPFTDLPEAMRKQYGYDPVKAAAYAAADDAAQQQAYAQVQAATAQARTSAKLAEIGSATDLDKRDAENREKVRLAGVGQGIARNAMIIRATVRQVLKEGVLVSYRVRIGLYNWPEDEQDGWIYVAGIQKGKADGDSWEGTVYPFGTYKYVGGMGTDQTVRGYATSAIAAAAMQDAQQAQ